jgi:hypothetical protein
MKRCPTCSRTYVSDDFTFCLDDGALLSAPYDPSSDKSTEQISGRPPKTEVLTAAQQPIRAKLPQAGTSEGPLVPTLTVPNRPAVTAPKPPAPAVTPPITLQRAHKTNLRVAYIAAVPLMLIVLILGGLFIFTSRCPTLRIYCSTGQNSTGCVVDGPPFWANWLVSQNVTWDWSVGGFRRMALDGALFDTEGHAGEQINVTATYRNWWCTTSASTSFIAR